MSWWLQDLVERSGGPTAVCLPELTARLRAGLSQAGIEYPDVDELLGRVLGLVLAGLGAGVERRPDGSGRRGRVL